MINVPLDQFRGPLSVWFVSPLCFNVFIMFSGNYSPTITIFFLMFLLLFHLINDFSNVANPDCKHEDASLRFYSFCFVMIDGVDRAHGAPSHGAKININALRMLYPSIQIYNNGDLERESSLRSLMIWIRRRVQSSFPRRENP